MFLRCPIRLKKDAGHFLRIVLAQLDEWHLSGTAYRKGNRKGEKGEGPILPGFIKKSGWLTKYPNLNEDEILSHADFKLFVAKLHKKILKVSVADHNILPKLRPFPQGVFACLGSNDFVSVKNALMVLSDILPVFPLKRVVPSIGMLLESAVKTFQSDERSDIKVLAIGWVSICQTICQTINESHRPATGTNSICGGLSGL